MEELLPLDHNSYIFLLSIDAPTIYISIEGVALMPDERVNAVVGVPINITCTVEGSYGDIPGVYFDSDSGVFVAYSEPPTETLNDNGIVTTYGFSLTATVTVNRHDSPSTALHCYGNRLVFYEQVQITLDVTGK